MRFSATLLMSAVAFVTAEETAVEEENKLEPTDIPRDKCGVVVSSHEDDRLCIFAVGQDQQIYHKFQTSVGGEWSSWSSLGGTFRGGPRVVRNAFAKQVLFARGADKAIWTKMQVQANGEAWTSWTSLGGKFSSSPVSILNSEGFLHIFAKNFADNSLMHKFQFANTNGTCWSEWASLGGSLTSIPSVLLDAESLLHVFVRGPDRALWHKRQLGTHQPRSVVWEEWKTLGGVLASAPSVPSTLNAVNLLEIFVRASDKAFWYKHQSAGHDKGVKWNEWAPLGGIFASGPSAVLNADNLVEVFGRGADKGVWHKSQFVNSNGTVTWGRWTSLGGMVSTGVGVKMTYDGLLHVFVRGVDKNIWYKYQSVANDTISFGSWKSLGGNARAFPC